jgi:hypothetical protein
MKVKIPKSWSPEQAEAIADFVSDLEFAIRKQYQVKILNHQLTELKREEKRSYLHSLVQEKF